MTLEEYEPNPEFIGRNFNAGEVIQLVLKTREGGWLSFPSVVMVMMHELAHCVQMNHSGAFWMVRNAFAEEMRGLWARGYTGEGVWGGGRVVESGEGEEVSVGAGMGDVRGLCGGTYRSGGGRKRKRKVGGGEKLSYAERQQRRIARKFGVGGVKVGDDEETRVKLEDGKKPKGRPRVARSKRGRELRAAAALARFGEQKELKEEDRDSGSESESELEEGVKKEEARGLDGSRMLDSKGQGMIKVCEDEDADDVHVKEEMQELQDINYIPATTVSGDSSKDTAAVVKKEPSIPDQDAIAAPQTSTQSKIPSSIRGKASTNVTCSNETKSIASTCPICSMLNDPSSLLCTACSHVLDIRKMPGHWRCKSSVCNGSLYVNAADCGLCGACGSRKPDD